MLFTISVNKAGDDIDFSVTTNAFALSYNTWVHTIQNTPYGAYNAKEALQWAELEKGFRHLKTEHSRFFK